MLYKEIDQIVSTTHDTINRMLEYKNGPDALALYFRYIQQKKMQENNQTWSNNNFMQKAMGWGKLRFQNAKNVLIDNGFIQKIQKRDEGGRVIGRYIKVNFVVNKSRGLLSQTLGNPDGGKSETNTSIVNIDTPIVKENKKIKKENGESSKTKDKGLKLEDYFESRNDLKKIGKVKGFKQCRRITPDIRNKWNKIKKKYSDEDIEYGTNNYAKCIKSRTSDMGTFYEHRYSLYEFLTQGNALVRYINQ